MRLPKEHLQLGAHFIVTAVFMSSWMAGLGRPAIVTIVAVTGAVFHTLADTAVDPSRGGDRLTGTIVSNLLFSTMMPGILAVILPPI